MQMTQNSKFWSNYPIYLNANATALSDQEKAILKRQKLEKQGGDPHVYHPFLEKTIDKANKMNQTNYQNYQHDKSA
jgi:hypothetical protein